MKKSVKKNLLLSLVVSMFFGIMTFPVGSITGYAAFNMVNNSFSFNLTDWLTSTILIFIGSFFFINIVFTDSLQEKLSRMEQVNPSSEMSLSKPQTRLGRRKWWGGRRAVEYVEQNDKKYAKKVLDPQPGWEDLERMERSRLSPEERQKAEDNYSKARFALRKIEYKTRTGNLPAKIDDVLDIDSLGHTYFKYSRESIRDLLYDLESEYEKLGGKKNKLFGDDRKMSEKEMIQNLISYYGPVRAALEKNAKEYLSSGRERKLIRELDRRLLPILKHQKAISRGGSYNNAGEMEALRNDFVSSNLGDIQYVDLSMVSKQGVDLLHGIPAYVGSRDMARAGFNNPSFARYLERLGNNHSSVFDGGILLDGLIRDKPAISTFGVSPVTSERKFFQPFGVILGDSGGKIYDASNGDLVSKPVGNKSEVRLANDSGENSSLEERVDSATRYALSNNIGAFGSQDEFLVGGDYTIKGIYALPQLLENEETAREIYQLGKTHNLPIYTFQEGVGLVPYEQKSKSKNRIIKRKK
jgi:hypothetical protein